MGRIPTIRIFSNYSPWLGNHATSCVVCCNNSAGLLLLTVWLLSLPKRISAKKKLQLAEATKRRKLLYTSSTQLLLLFISTKLITKYRKKLFYACTTKYTLPNNKIAVVESPELDLVAPRANAEGDQGKYVEEYMGEGRGDIKDDDKDIYTDLEDEHQQNLGGGSDEAGDSPVNW